MPFSCKIVLSDYEKEDGSKRVMLQNKTLKGQFRIGLIIFVIAIFIGLSNKCNAQQMESRDSLAVVIHGLDQFRTKRKAPKVMQLLGGIAMGYSLIKISNGDKLDNNIPAIGTVFFTIGILGDIDTGKYLKFKK